LTEKGVVKRRNASLFKKGLSENGERLCLRNTYNPHALSGVINRRNGCG